MFALYNFQAGSLVDIFFHLWVIFSLVTGIIANAKLKKLPPDEDGTPAVSEADESYATGEEIQNSNALGVADPNVKARILLETNESGHNITYRRVKKTNELVIDGYVYDEYTATLELPHSLEARINGIHIKAGLDSTNSSYITIDGNIIEKKLRLY